VTPSVHKIHHSTARHETNSNYGNLLLLYDRIFGTFTPLERAARITYGLGREDARKLASLPHLIAMPFKRADTASALSGGPS
jgi:sterol desaturase/sphingolipid hydroxylase (fatty acid hydroxylase superfamily)